MMLTSIMCVSCAKSEEGDEDKLGSIYGIVTELGTAEPMKAVGVELYKKGASSSKDALLLKTVTFDDGHFEFKDLNPGNYQVKVMADGYDQIEDGYVIVEAGRQARIDLQVKKPETGLVVKTTGATVDGIGTVILNAEFTYENYKTHYPSEVGFVYSNQNNPSNGGTIVKCKNDEITIKGDPFYSTTNTIYSEVTGLSEGTYYFQAYAINSKGTAYGEVRSFTIQHPDYITFSNLMIQTRDLGRFRLHEAKELCASSRVGGYSDWRLPTVAELSMIYQFKDEIGGFKKNSYWSSTDSADRYYYVDFSSGSQYSSYSTEYKYVRAVRTVE